MPRSCTAEGCVVNTAGVLCYKHRTHCNTCKERLGGGSKSSKGKCNHCRRGGLCKHPSGCAKRYGNTTGGRKSKLCAGHRRQSSKDDASHADTVVQAPDAGGNGPRTQGLSAAESHRIYLRHDILKATRQLNLPSLKKLAYFAVQWAATYTGGGNLLHEVLGGMLGVDAVADNGLAVLAFLLEEKQVDWNTPTSAGETALGLAARHTDLRSAFKAMIKHVSANATLLRGDDADKFCILSALLTVGEESTFSALISAGGVDADWMSTKPNTVSLLELAASSELRECVIALVGAGATNNEPWVTADSFVFVDDIKERL